MQQNKIFFMSNNDMEIV